MSADPQPVVANAARSATRARWLGWVFSILCLAWMTLGAWQLRRWPLQLQWTTLVAPQLQGDGSLIVQVHAAQAPGTSLPNTSQPNTAALPTASAPSPTVAGAASAQVYSIEATAPAGPALAAARVKIYAPKPDHTWALVAQGQTDAAGHFAQQQLPGGALWVLVQADGYARLSQAVQLFGERTLRVELQPAQQLRVQVQDDESAAIAGATVLVHGSDALPFAGLSEADGSAQLTRLSRGPYRVQVFARGFEAFERVGIEGDLKVVLRRLGGLSLSVVQADGSAAANAEVSVVGSSLWPARRLATDAAGKTHVGGLLAGTYELRARLGDQVTPQLLTVALLRGERKELTLRLVQGRYVQVLAVTEAPEHFPVANAHVVLAEEGLSPFPHSALTDAEGKARVGPLSHGAASVSVQATGYIGRGAVTVPPEGNEPVRVELLRGATLEGKVVDAYGHAIAGASIEILGFDLDGLPISTTPELAQYRDAHFAFALKPLPLIPAGELGVTLGHVPFVNEANLPRAWATEPDVATPAWVSDVEGRFKAYPVPPGRVRALVRHPAYVEGFSETVQLAPAQTRSLSVVLHEGGQLQAQVVDERGFPIAGARVLVTSPNGSYERNLQSERDGSFALAAMPAEVSVALARPEDPTRFVLKRQLQLQRGETLTTQFVLPAPRATLHWRVADEQDEPIELAQVSVHSIDPDVPVRVTQFTRADGQIELEDLAGLAVRVTVQAPGYAPLSLQFAAAPEQRSFTLERGALVVGQVTAVRGRVEVMGARVTLKTAQRTLSAMTDGRGNFSFPNAPTGKATLRVAHSTYAAQERQVEISDTGRADRPFELEVVDLEEGARLSGVVLDNTGEPVPSARVSVQLAALTDRGGDHVAITDAQGRFTLSGVTPGQLQLYAQSASLLRGSLALQVEAGDELTDLELELSETAPAPEISGSNGGVLIRLGEQDDASGTHVLIVSVSANSEAERAGLAAGDVLLRVDGTAVTTLRDARSRLQGKAGQDRVVTVARSGSEQSFRVRLEATTP